MFSFDGKREPENHPRFRRAGPTNHGLLALDNPEEERLHTKNPSRFARGFFVFRRFRVACATRRADKLVHFLLRECSRRESAAVDAVYHYDLPCEKANQENPQIFLICKYKNNFSAEYAQSNAEGI